jgi:glutamyl-tRNA reductase
MSLMVVGCNHTTVPLETLERLTIGSDAIAKALTDLVRREHLTEVVVLSTCNRTEVYAHCTRFHPAVLDVRSFFSDHSGIEIDALDEGLYTYYDDAAASHLFSVAAGVDSLVLGEGEILGQVRRSWQTAVDAGTSGAFLARTFRHAIETGKRARTETGIAQFAVSVSAAAVALAEDVLGSLVERKVLVLGAGEIGAGIVHGLRVAGATDITIVNRTPEHAAALAAEVGGQVRSLRDVADALSDADVLLASTGATTALLDRSDLEAVVATRAGRPLLIVDVAVPRDIDPSVGELASVTLLDMADLYRVVDAWREQKAAELDAVRAIVRDEVERFLLERSARSAAPIVTALRGKADGIRQGELDRFATKLAALSPEDRATVEALLDGLVNKLLHEPTMRVKDAAGTARGDVLSDALSDLFALDDEAGESAPQ